MEVDVERAAKIAATNDRFRKRVLSPNRDQLGTEAVYTQGIHQLLAETGNSFTFFSLIATYDAFNEDNDPYGEHDFGSLDWHGNKVFWKIDYYDQQLQYGCDPLEPDCRRVITIMLAGEY